MYRVEILDGDRVVKRVWLDCTGTTVEAMAAAFSRYWKRYFDCSRYSWREI